jgi:hypothetical protein
MTSSGVENWWLSEAGVLGGQIAWHSSHTNFKGTKWLHLQWPANSDLARRAATRRCGANAQHLKETVLDKA